MSDGRRALAEDIARRLREKGHRALFAGGCVRDLVIGITPKDYDIATSARPEQVQALFERTVPVGASFGVVLVLPDGETPFEVATFRKDLGYTDRRRPDAIEFTDEREDAQRRDFTINGMFLDPERGEVLDYVGGRADIARRTIAAIGDPAERINEDRLRMLRAVRFAARFQFSIEANTLAEIKRHGSSVVMVSAERIRDELVKMLTAGDPAVAIDLLQETGQLKAILPEVAVLRAMEATPLLSTGAAWDRTLVMLAMMRKPGTALAMAVLLHEIGWATTPDSGVTSTREEAAAKGALLAAVVMNRLRFSNDLRERVEGLVRDQLVVGAVSQMRPAARIRFLRGAAVNEQLELHRLDCLAGHGRLDEYAYCVKALESTPAAALRPEPLVSGRDLIEMGLNPGPLFRAILADLEDAQLEGTIGTREQALERVRREHARP